MLISTELYGKYKKIYFTDNNDPPLTSRVVQIGKKNVQNFSTVGYSLVLVGINLDPNV